MRIDHSRWQAFWQNPERYRLTYERNLVPVETPFPLARGIHMHSLHEARNKSLTAEATSKLVAMNEGVTDKAQLVGAAMYAAFRRKWDGDKRFKLAFENGKPLAELEFDVAIPGSPHRLVGKMDEVIEFDGELWNGDLKSANAKSSELRKRDEFKRSTQPIFYVNAGRLMGYPMVGTLYRVVTEHNPPQHWLIPVRKTEHELSVGLLNIHQTCELIEMMRRTFGPDMPWPHTPYQYPCNYDSNGKSACEYAGICTKMPSELEEDDLIGLKPRIDHLELMRDPA